MMIILKLWAVEGHIHTDSPFDIRTSLAHLFAASSVGLLSFLVLQAHISVALSSHLSVALRSHLFTLRLYTLGRFTPSGFALHILGRFAPLGFALVSHFLCSCAFFASQSKVRLN